MIKHILFDFDGTLADTLHIFVDIYNEIAGKQDFVPVKAHEIAELSRLSIPERCRRLRVPMYRLPALKKVVLRRFEERMGDIRLFPGIPELLKELNARRIPAWVLSSNSAHIIEAVLKQNRVLTKFEAVLPSSSLFGKDKSLRSFVRAQRMGARELLYVGDELRDMEACRKAGVSVAAVTWGFDHQALLAAAGPDLLAHKPSDIEKWI